MIIISKNGKEIIVDDDINPEILKYSWNASLASGGVHYAKARIRISKGKYKTETLHRVIMNAKKGECVDHINSNTLDNRKCNLRLCVHVDNLKNQKKPKNNTSGYKGVTFYKNLKKKPYRAYININYKQVYLGYYETAEEAGLAYNKAAIKYFNEFAKLNII
jgi:hypothetical protein